MDLMEFSETELKEAHKQFLSIISKSEKVLEKLKEGSPQKTLTDRRLKAYGIAVSLIEKQLDKDYGFKN